MREEHEILGMTYKVPIHSSGNKSSKGRVCGETIKGMRKKQKVRIDERGALKVPRQDDSFPSQADSSSDESSSSSSAGGDVKKATAKAEAKTEKAMKKHKKIANRKVQSAVAKATERAKVAQKHQQKEMKKADHDAKQQSSRRKQTKPRKSRITKRSGGWGRSRKRWQR